MINDPSDHNSLQDRLLRQAPWRTQTQGTSLVLAAVIMVAVIGALYLAQASRTAGAGRRLQDLEGQREQLEQQNAQLRAEIAALRSVPRLIGEAQAMGYHQASADEVDYLVVRGVAPPTPQPVEDKVRFAAPEPASESEDGSVQAYDETLGSYLTEKFTGFREGLAAFWQATFGTTPTPAPSSASPTATRVP